MADWTRRDFLTVLPAAALVAGCGSGAGGNPPATDMGVVTLSFLAFPPLEMVGGGVAQPLGLPIVVVRTSTVAAVALGGICTHQACPLTYPQGALEIYCNCHNARFDLTGAVVSGPAPIPLPSYPAIVLADSIQVTL